MECECCDAGICSDEVYGEPCVWLAERGSDCTVIDVGCGSMPKLHELQRHLRKHGVKVYTIGIDIQDCDAEVDEFIHANMLDVRLPGMADVVIYNLSLGYFRVNPAGFKTAVNNCADWLKPDGLFFTDLGKRWTPSESLNINPTYFVYRAMSRDETREHALQCHGAKSEQCPHGRELNMRLMTRVDQLSFIRRRKLAKGMTWESYFRNVGIDPQKRVSELAACRWKAEKMPQKRIAPANGADLAPVEKDV